MLFACCGLISTSLGFCRASGCLGGTGLSRIGAILCLISARLGYLGLVSLFGCVVGESLGLSTSRLSLSVERCSLSFQANSLCLQRPSTRHGFLIYVLVPLAVVGDSSRSSRCSCRSERCSLRTQAFCLRGQCICLLAQLFRTPREELGLLLCLVGRTLCLVLLLASLVTLGQRLPLLDLRPTLLLKSSLLLAPRLVDLLARLTYQPFTARNLILARACATCHDARGRALEAVNASRIG